MSSDSTPLKVPKRVPMACIRCRDRKVKCVPITGVDVQRCERCEQQGHLDCEYRPVPSAATASSSSSSRPSTIPLAPVPAAPIPPYQYQVLPSPYGHGQPPQGPPNPTNANTSNWNARISVIDPELMGGVATFPVRPDQGTHPMSLTPGQGNAYPGGYAGQQQYPPSAQPYNHWAQPQYPPVTPSYPLGGGGVEGLGSIGLPLPSSNPGGNSNYPTDTYGRYQNPRNSER